MGMLREIKDRCQTKLTPSRAGILAALAVIMFFILLAVFVPAVFFAFLLAWLLLPLEKFWERCWFRTRPARRLSEFCDKLFAPVKKFRSLLIRHSHGMFQEKCRTPEEEHIASENMLTAKASGAALLMMIAVALAAFLLIILLMSPLAISGGQAISSWTKSNEWFAQADKAIEKVMSQKKESAGREQNSPATVRQALQLYLSPLLSGDFSVIAEKALSSGQDVVAGILRFISWLGKFTVTILISLCFCFFFLQKMAFYTACAEKEGPGTSIGQWTVRSIFLSGWLPAGTEEMHRTAGSILDHILVMVNSWLRGFFWIISSEFILYSIAFLLFGVPYAMICALFASCAILLPVLGPVFSAGSIVIFCLVFCESNVVVTLVCALLTFAVINLVVEQIFLYPTLIGGVLGLKTLETITVVLLGASIFGVVGMLLAVPTAALLKYLIPLFYQMWNSEDPSSMSTEKDLSESGSTASHS